MMSTICFKLALTTDYFPLIFSMQLGEGCFSTAPCLVQGSFSRHKLPTKAKIKMKNWAQLYILPLMKCGTFPTSKLYWVVCSLDLLLLARLGARNSIGHCKCQGCKLIMALELLNGCQKSYVSTTIALLHTCCKVWD